jgi:uncharacterized repeat protein (TIGR01451 family)
LRRFLSLGGGIVATGIILASLSSTAAAAAGSPHLGSTASTPVPSLTPAATQRLWSELVQRRDVRALRTAECRPLRAVFYAPTDWFRLTTKLAATRSACAQYYVSVPPLASDKTRLRSGEAERIRALGPEFHALAEINVTGWSSWVTATGNSWYAAGLEARRRMAAAGYDVALGDTWALNELSSAVRQGVGVARANMRAFLQGLYDGDGVLRPSVRGVVFVAGIGQATSDLSVYQARLQEWFEDAAFWSDVSRYASDFSQEVYGDLRTYAVAGTTREARRDSLNEYLQHQASLAAVAPGSGDAARAFLAATYSPLANAAWQYDAAFGWTNTPADLMQDYISAQTYAMRAAGNSRFGFAWSPANLAGIPTVEFAAQTDALLVRLAAAIADSGDVPEAACGSTWCNRTLDGAAATTAWRTFAAWKPSLLAFTTAPQTLSPGVPSAPFTVELRTSSGTPYTAGLPVTVELSSSSGTGEFSTTSGGPWTATLSTSITSAQSVTSFYFRDASSGSPTIAAAAAGKIAASQAVTVAAASPPAETTPPPPPPPPSSGGSSGAGPDLLVAASAAPAAPAVGATLTYTVAVRNLGSLASRAFVAIQLPSQVAYTASQTDRGPGCTGTTTLTCDLDFLAGDLVGTVRVQAGVREPGTLTLTATSSAQPGDIQPANDTASVVTVVAPPAPLRPPAIAAATLRLVGTTPASVARRGKTASVSIRFRISDAARLQARLTPLRSTRAVPLLQGTSFAGSRSSRTRTAAATAVPRQGAYLFRAQVGAARLIRGRTYLVRLTAVAADGRQRALTIRFRA